MSPCSSGIMEAYKSNNVQGIQQLYYISMKSQRTGKLWIVSLITKLWDKARNLWEHHKGILYQQDSTTTKENQNGKIQPQS